MDEISVTQSMQLLRRQRHSFLNHLQVISGWLQLDRPERARQYLEAVAARMAGESEVFRQVPAHLGLTVLELDLEAETHGAQVEWQVDGQPGDLSPEAEAELRQQVLGALTAVAGAGQDDRRIIVRLGPGTLSVHTPSGKGEG